MKHRTDADTQTTDVVITELASSRNPGPVIEVVVGHTAMAIPGTVLIPGMFLQVVPSSVSDGTLVTATHSANTIVLQNVQRPSVYYVVDVLVSLDVQGVPAPPAHRPSPPPPPDLGTPPTSVGTWLQQQPSSSSEQVQSSSAAQPPSPSEQQLSVWTGHEAVASGQENAAASGLAHTFRDDCQCHSCKKGVARRRFRAAGTHLGAPGQGVAPVDNPYQILGGPPPPPSVPPPRIDDSIIHC